MAEPILAGLKAFPHAAAIKADVDLDTALASRVPVVFILRGNGLEIAPTVSRIHDAGKLAAVHLDLVDGVAPDRSGVAWLARSGSDAIISSHGDAVRAVRAEGVIAIQRLLLLRRSSLESGLAAIARASPDIVELLPGILLPCVANLIPPRLQGVPLLAGGFIRTSADAAAILQAGAIGITTSTAGLWS